MNDEAQRCTAPAYKGNNIAEIWRRALDRCGKTATVRTRWGWRCADCAKWHEERDKDPHTLINIIKDAMSERTGKRKKRMS